MPVLTAFITGVTGFLNTFVGVSVVPAVVTLFSEVVLAGGSAYFFKVALSDAKRDTESEEFIYGVSMVILISCLLMALSQISIMNVISVGRFIAVI
jgi:hypothetical protein